MMIIIFLTNRKSVKQFADDFGHINNSKNKFVYTTISVANVGQGH